MAFAGTWYPGTAEGCLEQMRTWRDRDRSARPANARFCVAPHAGWMYSGRLSARAIEGLGECASPEEPDPSVRLVVLLGGHLRRDDPVVAMTAGEWETPFGVFPVYRGFDSSLGKLPNVVRETAQRHDPDNSIEVLLPIAKRKFPAAELLPIRVPPSEVALELGAMLARHLADTGLSAVVVASTDLTHYGPNYGFEPRGRGPAAEQWVREENDPQFIRAVEAGSGRAILENARRHRNACCPGAVAALSEIVRAQGSAPMFRVLDYATSLDASRGRGSGASSFVGYVAGVYG
jgi:AmmeMemoRadiSam system protein B